MRQECGMLLCTERQEVARGCDDEHKKATSVGKGVHQALKFHGRREHQESFSHTPRASARSAFQFRLCWSGFARPGSRLSLFLSRPLFHCRLEVETIALEGAELLLEVGSEGLDNWTFPKDARPGMLSRVLPSVLVTFTDTGGDSGRRHSNRLPPLSRG